MNIGEKFSNAKKIIDYMIVKSTSEYPDILPINKGFKVLDTHRNLEWLLSKFKIEVKYNLMTREREITIPNEIISPEDTQNSTLEMVHYIATVNQMPTTKNLDAHLDFLSLSNSYHPIRDWILKTPWDNTPRLDKFIATVKTTDDSLAFHLIKTWMVGGVEAAFSDHGFINNGCLTICGKQGIGKTRFFKQLAPPELNAIKEGAYLDPSNKDTTLQLNRYWINELGEIDSIFKKSEMGRLKSFITMQFDDVRRPYARRACLLPRRSIYGATVNDENFLVDETGNRRWWCITAQSINLDHQLDMQQVWAEVYQLWINGAKSYLPAVIEEYVTVSNKQYEKNDPLKELLFANYDWEVPRTRSLSSSEVLLELGYQKPNRSEATQIGRLLTIINGKGTAINGITRHKMPPKKLIR